MTVAFDCASILPQRPPLRVYKAGDDGLTAGQAAALNALLDALTDGIAFARAVLISDDRYAGAAAAGDQAWMAQQTAAVLHYQHELGHAYMRAADAADAWLAIYPGDIVPTAADVAAAQARLASVGFNAGEIARYHEIGAGDEEIENIRQAYVTADPGEKLVSLRQELAEFAAGARSLGNLLVNAPATFSQAPTGPGLAPAEVSSGTARLASVYDVERTHRGGQPVHDHRHDRPAAAPA